MTQKNKVPCENRANNSWLKIVIFESNLNNAWFLLKQMMIIWHKLFAHVCVKYYEIWLIVNHLEKTSKVFLFYTQNLAKSLFLFIPILENSLWYALFLYFYESSHCSTVTNSEYKHGLCYRCLKPRAIWKIYIFCWICIKRSSITFICDLYMCWIPIHRSVCEHGEKLGDILPLCFGTTA